MFWHCNRRITKCRCLLRACPYPTWYTRELHALLRADRKDLQTDDSSGAMVFLLSFLQCALKERLGLEKNLFLSLTLAILYLISFLSTLSPFPPSRLTLSHLTPFLFVSLSSSLYPLSPSPLLSFLSNISLFSSLLSLPPNLLSCHSFPFSLSSSLSPPLLSIIEWRELISQEVSNPSYWNHCISFVDTPWLYKTRVFHPHPPHLSQITNLHHSFTARGIGSLGI